MSTANRGPVRAGALPTPVGAAWVLLHGTPLTSRVWRDTARLLAEGQPVLTPDCAEVPATQAQQAIAARLAEELQGRVVDLVGHSFGGQIALELALLGSVPVRSLTILCSRDMPFPAFAAAAGAIREGRAPSVQETLARWFTAKELRDNGAAVRMARDELAHASESDWAAALDAIAGYDSSRRSPGLTMPVTLIAAGADAVSTPEVMTDMARRIPHAEIVVRPEWSHMSPFVDPTGLAELIRSSPRASTATRQ